MLGDDNPFEYSSPVYRDSTRILTSIEPRTLSNNIWDCYFQNYSLYSWMILIMTLLTSTIMLSCLTKEVTPNILFKHMWNLYLTTDNQNDRRAIKILDISFKIFLFFFMIISVNLMNTDLVSQDPSVYIDNLDQLFESSLKPVMFSEDPTTTLLKEKGENSIYKKVYDKTERVKTSISIMFTFMEDLVKGDQALISRETLLKSLSHWTCQRMFYQHRNLKFWLSAEEFLSVDWAFAYSKSIDKEKRIIIEKW